MRTFHPFSAQLLIFCHRGGWGPNFLKYSPVINVRILSKVDIWLDLMMDIPELIFKTDSFWLNLLYLYWKFWTDLCEQELIWLTIESPYALLLWDNHLSMWDINARAQKCQVSVRYSGNNTLGGLKYPSSILYNTTL